MRSYVVKRFSHFRHSRRRRIESASLLSRESTTLSFSNPQNGHFMGSLGTLIVTGRHLTVVLGKISLQLAAEKAFLPRGILLNGRSAGCPSTLLDVLGAAFRGRRCIRPQNGECEDDRRRG